MKTEYLQWYSVSIKDRAVILMGANIRIRSEPKQTFLDIIC